MEDLSAFSQAPYDVIFNIALQTDYDTLVALCSTVIAFKDVCTSDRFWQIKIHREFNPPEENYIFISDLYTQRETYLFFYYKYGGSDKNIARSNKYKTLITLFTDDYTQIKRKVGIMVNENLNDTEKFFVTNSIIYKLRYSLSSADIFYYPLILQMFLLAFPIFTEPTIFTQLRSNLATILLGFDIKTFAYLLTYTIEQMRKYTPKQINIFLLSLMTTLSITQLDKMSIILTIPEIGEIQKMGMQLKAEHEIPTNIGKLFTDKI